MADAHEVRTHSDNAGDVYAAAGSYSNTWDFQKGRGDFSGSFDRRRYSGTTQLVPGSNTNFNGNFQGGSRAGSLNGAFFASPSDAAAYQAGNFAINGRRYDASGIFMGQR